MKRVLIIPSNTDLNRGDQALVWESARLVQDVFGPNVECLLMAHLHSRDNQRYDLSQDMQNRQTAQLGFRFVNTILKHPGRKFANNEDDSRGYTKRTMLQWGGQALADYLRSRLLISNIKVFRYLSALLLTKEEKETLSVIKNSDAVFVKGGGFLHSKGKITDAYLMYFHTYHIRLAQVLGKPVIFLPNSIGPLVNPVARNIAKKTLEKCSLVTVREIFSQRFLESINIKSSFFPDLGFFLRPSKIDVEAYLIAHDIPIDQKKAAITVRPYRFPGVSDASLLYGKYIRGVANLVDHLVNKGYHITLMAHTLGPSSHEDDRIAIKDVEKELDQKSLNNYSVIEDYELNCQDMEAIYSMYNYMIGTRFHSVIFSLNVDVPSIAIAYGGNKGKGIMNVLGNDDYSIDMDKIEEHSLVAVFDKLESNRDIYLKNLKQKKEEINKQRIAMINSIREVLGIKAE